MRATRYARAIFQLYIGNICTPNLVRPGNWQSFQQVWVSSVVEVRFARIGLGFGVNGLNPHHLEQTADMIARNQYFVGLI